MAEHKPHPSNVPGDFYVEDGCCTMCLVPFSEAPELFGECQDPNGYSHCFVKQQPETPADTAKMLNAIRCAEFMCIRYRGKDRAIQLDLIEFKTGLVCDKLPPDLQKQVDQDPAQYRLVPAPQKPWWKFWG